ncbi:hypothetical protein VIAQ111709_14090 [Vibrio aquimaris]|uniref:Uncharacterized protein n=2 Tax=Vibrio aquimaris TaxID=2587862 RepID=A0A5P9CSI4_9VIBR|nr:hypothetical protein FIV01_20510 [Vibrio aquimaris]
MCVFMSLLSSIETSRSKHSVSSLGDNASATDFARSVRRVNQDQINKDHIAKRKVFSRQSMKSSSTIKLRPSHKNKRPATHLHQSHHIGRNNPSAASALQSQNSVLATSRLDLLAQHSKTNSIGEFIGRIAAHAVIDSIGDESLNITGINNKLLKPLIELALLGKIDSQPRNKDEFYQKLSKRKRFVYRKTYRKIKTCLSQPPSSDQPIKGWKSKRLHKVTSGIKNSILDQPELKNVHLKEMVSSKFNQSADTFVANSSLFIDKDYGKSKRHKLGYAITAGFIAVLRERTPGVVQRVNLANQVFDVGDAMTTAQSTVTLTKLNQALTNSFGDQVDGIAKTLSSTTKAVSDATSEVTFEKFSKAFTNFFWG